MLQPILQQILPRIRREQFETWFRSLVVERADEREVEFSVTSQFVRDWLHKNFLTPLQDAVQSASGGRRRVLLSLREEDGHDNLPLVNLPPAIDTPEPRPEPRPDAGKSNARPHGAGAT